MWNKSLLDNFRKMRNQFTTSEDVNLKGIPEKRERTVKKGGDYEHFLYKYEHLEEMCSKFNTKDLCYFFKTKANDMGIFKNLLNEFSVEEILLMIEFIFSGDQTYLDLSRTQPTVLASNWVNTIYRDSIDWANDSYVDKKTVTNKNTSKREWKSSTKKTKIGDWE